MPKTIVVCELCPRHCRLEEGQRGDCLARMHLDGKLMSLVYGKPCSVHVDPIEKKPLFHVLPGTSSFSIATAGCNLHCKYCQNWQISQRLPEELSGYDMPPATVVQEALKNRCRSIAYTYSDPVIFYEYAYDTSKLAKQNNLLNILVTAAFIEQKPLIDICPYIDAANVDLKGASDDYYSRMSDGLLKPVQAAIMTMKSHGVHVELTNLIVPTWNDNEKDIRKLCRWVARNPGVETPTHFSKFWPMHKLTNLPPTPVKTIARAWEIAQEEGLKYAYVGNIPGHPGNNTYCPTDKKIIIRRIGFQVLENHVKNGHCEFCNENIPGIWS